jgi:anti-sigma factor RsiW
MPDCPYISRLGAYCDGELSPDVSRAVEQHLAACESCSTELQRAGEMSALFAELKHPTMTSMELARLHRAVERADERSFLRFAAGISGIAASILIISAAWLYDAPRQGPLTGIAAQPEQTWEHLASTGDVQKLPQGMPQTGVAERDATDWMVVGMGGHRTHGNP